MLTAELGAINEPKIVAEDADTEQVRFDPTLKLYTYIFC
jgi:hypothetical protein